MRFLVALWGLGLDEMKRTVYDCKDSSRANGCDESRLFHFFGSSTMWIINGHLRIHDDQRGNVSQQISESGDWRGGQ